MVFTDLVFRFVSRCRRSAKRGKAVMTIYHEKWAPDSLTGEQLDDYLSRGWYRMQQEIFTTTHVALPDFYRVHWLRYTLDRVVTRPSHRKIRNLNRGFSVRVEPFGGITEEQETLYQRYRGSITFDGADHIQECLQDANDPFRNIFETRCFQVRDGGRLIAVGYLDLGRTAGAGIVNFFDPEYRKYSLGKFLMLLKLDFLRESGYRYYYPGYIVAGLPKMDYKLFVGQDVAEYFDADRQLWMPFREELLLNEEITALDQLEIIMAFYGK
jgi:arginine-tRNA-protein transferase